MGIISLTLVMGFCLIGCTTTVTTSLQDPSLPWQEQALLLPYGSEQGVPKIIGFDDIRNPFSLTNRNDTLVDAMVVAVIPPGTHTIHVRVTSLSYGREYISEIIEVAYEFQPGGRYVLFGTIKTSLLGIGDGATNARIMTVEEYRKVFAEYYGRAPVPPTPEKVDERFQSSILDRFEKAEAELNKPENAE